MGIRLKLLVGIFIFCAVYAFYYFALPALINFEKFNPFIVNYVKKEYNLNLKIDKPSFKTALSPAIWLKADEFSILNDDGSKAFSVKKPLVKISILPLVFGRLDVKYFNSDNIFADVFIDKSLNISLGQYLMMKTSDFVAM